MKYFLLLIVIILASAQTGRSQCAPLNPTGNIGFFPSTDLLPCVERGVFYDETFYLENVDSFVFGGFGTFTIDTLRIDSIGNVPCNLQWMSNKGNNTFGRAETGCIRIFGVSEDSVGQYELKIYVTLKASIIGTLQGELNDIVDNLQQLAGNLGIDFEFYIRVKEAADPCPNIDRSTNPPSAKEAQRSCPPIQGLLSANITGDSVYCSGTASQLALALSNVTNPAVEWMPAMAVTDATSPTTSLALTQSGYVTVGITDTANTGNVWFDRIWVQVDTASPMASFTTIINDQSIKLESFSTNGNSFSWTLGDQTTATGRVVLHTYAADGIYPVALTVTNACGTDVYYDTITIGTVGILNVNSPTTQLTLYPNPAQGSVNVSVEGLQNGENYSIAVFDLSGKQVVAPINVQHQASSTQAFSLSALKSGVYVFQIKTVHSSSFQKLIIY